MCVQVRRSRGRANARQRRQASAVANRPAGWLLLRHCERRAARRADEQHSFAILCAKNCNTRARFRYDNCRRRRRRRQQATSSGSNGSRSGSGDSGGKSNDPRQRSCAAQRQREKKKTVARLVSADERRSTHFDDDEKQQQKSESRRRSLVDLRIFSFVEAKRLQIIYMRYRGKNDRDQNNFERRLIATGCSSLAVARGCGRRRASSSQRISCGSDGGRRRPHLRRHSSGSSITNSRALARRSRALVRVDTKANANRATTTTRRQKRRRQAAAAMRGACGLAEQSCECCARSCEPPHDARGERSSASSGGGCGGGGGGGDDGGDGGGGERRRARFCLSAKRADKNDDSLRRSPLLLVGARAQNARARTTREARNVEQAAAGEILLASGRRHSFPSYAPRGRRLSQPPKTATPLDC